MMRQVYMIEGMRWKVVKVLPRRTGDVARLKCLDKPKTFRSAKVDFLRMIHKQRVS